MKMFFLPGITHEMVNEGFWIEKIGDADKIILNRNDIDEFNLKMLNKVPEMYDIEKYKDSLTREELTSIIEAYKIPEAKRYDINGNEVSQEFYNRIKENTNIKNIISLNKVRFGISIKNARIRTFPTEEAVFKTSEDKEFDRFQETECQAVEPVAILHTSKDGKWFFIQMYNYNGWAKVEDIAVAESREEVFEYIKSDNFIVVTGNRARTQFNHYEESVSCKDFYMGTRIPVETEYIQNIGNHSAFMNHIVKLPVMDKHGKLEIKHGLISMREDVNEGYLDYTRGNVLRQAFKLQGDRYDWGNKNNGRDCSSYVMYVFKTFGIRLPRNADEQERGYGISYIFDDCTSTEGRNKVFDGVKPGAAIFMDGHVMMYIGKHENEHFMIHDFHGYCVEEGDKYKFTPVNEIAVTSTQLISSNGVKYIDKFTSAVQFE